MKDIKIWKLCLIWFTSMFLLIVNEVFYVLISGDMEISDTRIIFIEFLLILLGVLICGRVTLKLVKERWNNFKRIANIKEILIVVATQIFLSIGISNLSLAVLASANVNKAIELLNTSYMNPTNNKELILVLISTVILAPILEEIIFRRIIFVKLNKRLSFISSALISSLLFGIGHESLGILGAVVFGVACCILYRKYNNLLVPIAVHFINNVTAEIFTVQSYFNGTLNERVTTISNTDIKMYFICGGFFTIITFVIFVRFIKNNKQYIKSPVISV